MINKVHGRFIFIKRSYKFTKIDDLLCAIFAAKILHNNTIKWK